MDINWIELIIGFFLGLGVEFLADYINKKEKAMKNRKLLQTLEGYWVEIIEHQPERAISLAKFEFNTSSSEHQLNGVNYFDKSENNKIYYEWVTEDLIFKPKTLEILYFYTVIVNGQYHERKHGFGLIRLERNQKSLVMKDGYFIDSGQQPNPRNITYFKALDIAKELNFDFDVSKKGNSTEFIKLIYQNLSKFKN